MVINNLQRFPKALAPVYKQTSKIQSGKQNIFGGTKPQHELPKLQGWWPVTFKYPKNGREGPILSET